LFVLGGPLPSPEEEIKLSAHEQIIVDDIVDYYRDLIRLGEDSVAMKEAGEAGLSDFNEIFTARINGVYKKNKLQALPAQTWPGVICQPYIFGKGIMEWSGADGLRGKVDELLREMRGGGNPIRFPDDHRCAGQRKRRCRKDRLRAPANRT
jgi:hypothetical protein